MKEEVVVGGGLKTYKLFEEVIEVLFEALNCWSVEDLRRAAVKTYAKVRKLSSDKR